MSNQDENQQNDAPTASITPATEETLGADTGTTEAASTEGTTGETAAPAAEATETAEAAAAIPTGTADEGAGEATAPAPERPAAVFAPQQDRPPMMGSNYFGPPLAPGQSPFDRPEPKPKKVKPPYVAPPKAPAKAPRSEASIKPPPPAPKQLPEYQERRRSEIGKVVSDKMQKTVVVSVERSKTHPIYKKVMRRTVKFMAHDELGSASGDTVRIIESRPMSRHKRWLVVEIVQKAEQI